MIKPWWIWGYWLSPLTYGQRAITVNEFTATRWMKVLCIWFYFMDSCVDPTPRVNVGY